MFANRLSSLKDPVTTLKNVRMGVIAELSHFPKLK